MPAQRSLYTQLPYRPAKGTNQKPPDPPGRYAVQSAPSRILDQPIPYRPRSHRPVEPESEPQVKEEKQEPQPPTNGNAMDLDHFLEEMQQQVKTETKEKQLKEEQEAAERNPDDRRRDRSDRDRDYRDTRDSRRHGRDYYPRESDAERRDSRERKRRDGSRPLSSKGKDADNTEEERSRYQDRYRGRGERRDRGGDYYSGGGRGGRSRSPRRGDRDRDDRREDRYRERSRDRTRRDTDDRRGGRRRTPTPEPSEDDRDKRTIFVQQISARAETRHLRQFFEAVGPVVEAQIVKDRVTGRSKGVGYVEFKDEESVPKALELTGQKLKGVPIIAQLTEAEKNRASRAAAGESSGASVSNGAPFHRLYVGNIHFSVTEEDLTEIFLPYGELEQVTLQRDEQQPTRSKGYGFVQFVDPDNAKKALSEMNGFDLAGRQIRVGLGNDKFTPESTAHLLRNFPAQAANYQGSAFSGAGGRGAYAGGSGGVFDRAHGRDDRGISGASALDDSDMSGVNFKQVDRAKLMRNLARNEVEVPGKQDTQPTARARAPVDNQPAPSKCIKIQNAFDADQELKQFGANWAKELEVEVKTECDKKYGKVVHIAVDPNSDGDIYVKFDSLTGGEKAMKGLNGRSFNSRTIRAAYVVDAVYNSLYAAAAAF